MGTPLRMDSHRSFLKSMPISLQCLRPQHITVCKVSQVSTTTSSPSSDHSHLLQKGGRIRARRNTLHSKFLTTIPKPAQEPQPSSINENIIKPFEVSEEKPADNGVKDDEFEYQEIEKPITNVNGADDFVAPNIEGFFELVEKENTQNFIPESENIVEEATHNCVEVGKEISHTRETSEGINYTNSTYKDLFIQKFRGMWSELVALQAQYHKEMQTWGFGNGPIFLITESENGKFNVSIDEKELRNRFPDENQLVFLGDISKTENGASLFVQKYAEAMAIVSDIEAGNLHPPRHSFVFKFVPSGSSQQSAVSNPVMSVIGKIPPSVKVSFIGFGIVVAASVFFWGVLKYFKGESSEKGQWRIRQSSGIHNVEPFPDGNGLDKIEKIKTMAKQARKMESQSAPDFLEQENIDFDMEDKDVRSRNVPDMRVVVVNDSELKELEKQSQGEENNGNEVSTTWAEAKLKNEKKRSARGFGPKKNQKLENGEVGKEEKAVNGGAEEFPNNEV